MCMYLFAQNIHIMMSENGWVNFDKNSDTERVINKAVNYVFSNLLFIEMLKTYCY